MDRAITIFLYAFSNGLEIVGYFFLLLTGYGWGWGPAIPYGEIFRNPGKAMRMEGFYTGLVVAPIVTAFLFSIVYNNWYVVLLIGGSIVLALLFNKFFKKNVFVPFFCGLIMLVLVIAACFMRLSVILLLFFFYVGLVLLGPLLLGLFLAAL